MKRLLLASAPLLLLPGLLGACASTGNPAADVAGRLDASSLAVMAPEGPGIGDYAMVLPENVVWVPWKIVGGTVKGLVDGVSAGFEPERLPIIGLLVSPINAALGTVTGLGNGIATSPMLIGPDDHFGDAMERPMTQKTPIWWY